MPVLLAHPSSSSQRIDNSGGVSAHHFDRPDPRRLRDGVGAKWTRYDDDVIPAWVADMDLGVAPAIRDALAAMVEREDLGYPGLIMGELGPALCDRYASRHGWEPDLGHVRSFTDVVQAIEATLWVATSPGDGVVVHTPIYPPFLGAVEQLGRELVDQPLVRQDGGWALDVDALRASPPSARVVMLCNPHNPSGHVLTAAELEAVAAVAVERDLLIVADEIHADLVHPGHRHVPIASLGAEVAARTLTLTSATKAFNVAGLRCAVGVVGPAVLRDAFAALPGHLLGAPSGPGVVATLAAWRHGDGWLDDVMAHLTANRDHLAARLAAEAPMLGHGPPDATFLSWIDATGLGVEDPTGWLLRESRVALSAGERFGPPGVGHVRLNFATSRRLLDEIVDRMVEAIGRI